MDPKIGGLVNFIFWIQIFTCCFQKTHSLYTLIVVILLGGIDTFMTQGKRCLKKYICIVNV